MFHPYTQKNAVGKYLLHFWETIVTTMNQHRQMVDKIYIKYKKPGALGRPRGIG